MAAATHVATTFSVGFGGPNVIRHSFCDAPQMMELSGSSGNLQEIGVTVFSAIPKISCLVSIVVCWTCWCPCTTRCSPSTLNTLIYSLRNGDVSAALRRVLGPHIEKILFVVVLIFYLLTLVGNTAWISVAMYFFLSHLSLEDHCFTTDIVPPLLWNLRGPLQDHHRVAAICLTLHYTTAMHPWLCQVLVRLPWMCGVGDTAIQATVIFLLPRCGHQLLPHFTCEIPALLKLACVDVRANEIQLFVGTLVLNLLPLSMITVSYRSIAWAMLRIKSPQGWRKALGTCGSYLLVVTLFYRSIRVVYIWPNSSFSGTLGKFLTLFYTVVAPTLNSLIYTLREQGRKGGGWSTLLCTSWSNLLAVMGNLLIVALHRHSTECLHYSHVLSSSGTLSVANLCYISVTAPQSIHNS
ncbi:olfactory receptor 2G3-like [Tachyglossus aculeatus]|uniref:olfactory receptor 2G3-like n=1 Tax=Tachyglossus aculeatus TaxID=9261 RepID=UPI0018F7274A|nr:olfactory receptor 2G3-like [Tachyglossus aculeatus]